jgi:signal transduction histidine kinase
VRVLAVLRERGRLARDLHDTLGHTLVLVAVKLEAARRLREVDAARADCELAATQEIVRQAMADFRASLDALRAPSQGCEPLALALARRAREAGQRAGWRVIFDVSPEMGGLNDRVHEALLRVGGEALTNAERHAGARTLRLTLQPAPDDTVLLRVADDGVGFDLERQASGRYGIVGMRERVEALRGCFSIEAGAEGGTVVEARVPAHLSPASTAEEAPRSGADRQGEREAAAATTVAG